MNKKKQKLFPVLVVSYENFLSAEQLRDIFDFCMYQHESEHHGLLIGENCFSSFHKNEFLIELLQKKINSCKTLKEKLNYCLSEYAEEYGLNKIKITNSWFNIQNQNSMLVQHYHQNSVVSGGIYINCDEESSPLCFENPNPFILWNLREYNCETLTEYSRNHIKVYPTTGMLILFPSWLKHGSAYQKNNTKNRMVISFNTYME